MAGLRGDANGTSRRLVDSGTLGRGTRDMDVAVDVGWTVPHAPFPDSRFVTAGIRFDGTEAFGTRAA